MSTRNFVPRADEEGGLGTAGKRWASAHSMALFAHESVFLKTDPSALADLGVSGNLARLTIDSGQSPAFGSLLRVASDGELELCDASDIATMPALFMATGNGTGAQDVIAPGAIVRNDAWNWTPGGLLYTSATPGEMTHTAPSSAGEVVQAVAVALSADVILFQPSLAVAKL